MAQPQNNGEVGGEEVTGRKRTLSFQRQEVMAGSESRDLAVLLFSLDNSIAQIGTLLARAIDPQQGQLSWEEALTSTSNRLENGDYGMVRRHWALPAAPTRPH
jgi:hypothetical protein